MEIRTQNSTYEIKQEKQGEIDGFRVTKISRNVNPIALFVHAPDPISFEGWGNRIEIRPDGLYLWQDGKEKPVIKTSPVQI